MPEHLVFTAKTCLAELRKGFHTTTTIKKVAPYLIRSLKISKYNPPALMGAISKYAWNEPFTFKMLKQTPTEPIGLQIFLYVLQEFLLLQGNLFTRIHFMSSKNSAEYKDLVRTSNICSPSIFLNLRFFLNN